MKKSLPAALLAAAVLPGCVLFGIYSYTTTVRFSEIVQLPDDEEVTVKRKQWIKKEGYYVGKSSRSIKEQLVIIDPETQKKLPIWENEHLEVPYFLYKNEGECEWVLIANPFLAGHIYFIEQGYFKIIEDGGKKYYTPTVVAYCFYRNANKWEKIPVPNYAYDKKEIYGLMILQKYLQELLRIKMEH